MIRVLVERWLLPGTEERFRNAMHELRREAVRERGYISGETLCDMGDPLHWVILSTWSSAGDWDAWSVSDKREEALAKIARFLQKPERVTVLEPA